MYGTLRGALSAREAGLDLDTYTATVEGRIEGAGRTGQTIRITEISVHYDMTIAAGKRTDAERALRVHPAGCPAHESVKDAIKITWTADITEAQRTG